MKKLGVIILIFIGSLVIVSIGPVWLQRLTGYTVCVDRNFSPQWISNDKYCYLRVRNYYDIDIFGWADIPFPQKFNPFVYLSFRCPNATFYIYEVDINHPNSKKLIRKITEKVNFSIRDFWQKILGKEFTFRRLDNGELVLFIRGRSLRYVAYYMNSDGKILKKRIFDYNYLDGKDIIDISPDGKKILLGADIKDIASGRKVSILDWKNKWFGPVHWISKDKMIDYNRIDIKEKKITPYEPTKVKYEIYLIDENKKNSELVCTKDFLEYSKSDKRYKELPSYLDAALFSEQNLLFLSKIGIFKKEGEKWQEIKDLKDMEFNLYYPDWSFDGKRIVGVSDDENLKVIEVKDLLKN